MKDGFTAVYNFINENKIDTMEKFVMKLPIFPPHIQRILAHKHEEYKLRKMIWKDCLCICVEMMKSCRGLDG